MWLKFKFNQPWFSKLRTFILLNYFTFAYYLKLIQVHHLYHDRRLFPSLPLYWRKYDLPQTRALYGPEMGNLLEQQPAAYHLTPHPGHLQFVKYFSLFFALRGLIVCALKGVTATEERRLLSGTAAFKRDSFYVEVPLTFWSTMVALFLHLTLNRPLLDFKFLAILLMNNRNGEAHFKPHLFGFSPLNYRRFTRFRFLFLAFYLTIISLLPTVGMAASIALFLPFYTQNLLISLFWTLAFLLWCPLICATIYSTLIVFLLTVIYLQIKQKAILTQIEPYLQAGKRPVPLYLWLSYSYLYSELGDYSTFWSGHLTVLYGAYLLIIVFLLYVVLFTQISPFITAIHLMALTFHLILLSVITFYCATIVKANRQVAFRYTGKVGQMKSSTVKGLLKLHNIGEYLQESSESGFTLRNGYLVTRSTFQTLIINIAIYFLLIKKNADSTE